MKQLTKFRISFATLFLFSLINVILYFRSTTEIMSKIGLIVGIAGFAFEGFILILIYLSKNAQDESIKVIQEELMRMMDPNAIEEEVKRLREKFGSEPL